MNIKLITLGNISVGKTALIRRYCQEQFTADEMATVGIDFMTKQETLLNGMQQEIQAKLTIFDTAGSERFHNITNSYYTQADGVLFVFALNDRESYEQIENWADQFKQRGKTGVPFVLVGNKADLQDTKNVFISEEECLVLATKLDCEYFEVSAKSEYGLISRNIKDAFKTLATQSCEQKQLRKSSIGQFTGKVPPISTEYGKFDANNMSPKQKRVDT